ncbi:polysaccharide deacetylase family protein [Paenibacillus sp. PR3]|uniref:Polysaccharide deacetylase family protein n=1 Tax=Paenibacillus terricola TaxID=2763503 RepID=A0ABR8MNG9_9BACL|nr:polysaccharide deacetylase family protein [Paenibacillus terricola]MBD3917559.1 polysaccharide deacetylase family protein [Paenibacillus terricola]
MPIHPWAATAACIALLVPQFFVPYSTPVHSITAHAHSAEAPVKKDRYYYEKRGDVVWEVKTDRPLIALTFDDGPDPKQTNAILDLLKQYGARCTFFVIGKRVDAFPETAFRIVSEGHEIANHTYNHTYFQNSSPQQIQADLKKTEEAIQRATGEHSVLFRPPGGMFNEKLVATANSMGLKPILWSWHQDTKDWVRPGVAQITNKVLRNAHNGDIVLFHDHIEGKSQTIQALATILPELTRRGFQFVTVSELMKDASVPQQSNQQSNLLPD